MAADLHLHTTASDGSWTPTELIYKAIELDLSAIAITDHDTIDGIAAVESEAFPELVIIPGIEFSTEYQDHEVHILGYGIDISSAQLLAVLQQLKSEREERALAMVEKLNKLGYAVDYEHVRRLAGSGVIGRVHIAQALIELGYTASIKESFSRFLAFNAPAYVPRKKLTSRQAVELIKAVGGVPVLAHPGLIGDDHIVVELVNLGIDGLEVIHSNHTASQIRQYARMVDEFHLLPTGGSDCHGPKGKDEILIGRYLIPDQWVKNLQFQLTKS